MSYHPLRSGSLRLTYDEYWEGFSVSLQENEVNRSGEQRFARWQWTTRPPRWLRREALYE